MNRKTNTKAFITWKQMINAIDGAYFAWRWDMPLTRIIHINFLREDIRGQVFVSAFTKLAGDWLNGCGAPRVYIWCLEHPLGTSLNLHLLIHVPGALMNGFVRKERGWLIRAGMRWEADVLRSSKLRGENSAGGKSDADYLVSLENSLGYFLKGGPASFCSRLGIDHKFQGSISGKRLGLSASIDRKVRAKAGYQSPASPRSALIFPGRFRCVPGE